jgi:hypothetical protein
MLHSKRFGVAGGITFGALMFIVTALCLNNNYGYAFLEMMGSLYPGYSISEAGCILGFIYGFITGFIVFYSISRLYNRLPNPRVSIKD